MGHYNFYIITKSETGVPVSEIDNHVVPVVGVYKLYPGIMERPGYEHAKVNIAILDKPAAIFGKFIRPGEPKELLGLEDADFYIKGLSDRADRFSQFEIVFLNPDKQSRKFIDNPFRIHFVYTLSNSYASKGVRIESAYIYNDTPVA